MDKFDLSDITIAIVSFKSEEIIENSIKSINPKIPIIVVENSNNNNFKENLEKNFKNVKCILAKDNVGYSVANNIAINNSITKLVFIINPDVELLEGTMDRLIEAANKVKNFAILAPLTQEDIDYLRIHDDRFKDESITEVYTSQLKGCAMLLNKIEFNNISYFDENYFLYFEELDLCTKLVKNKKLIYLIPKARFVHLGGKSHNPNISYEMELSRNWHFMWSSFYFTTKYKGYFYSFFSHIHKLILYFLKSFLYLLLFNKKKFNIYKNRFSGLFNSMLKNKSWYRPRV
ncbi:MAG: hypothetical protein CBC24_03485 [Candidatus Pelagibacter sp. TMED64]|nr:hypothetical protein [Candidatus Pelagibacter sp.]OUU66283.1 MAG: hypothetical protein CBC24_03485 [Candidatus Pelagibacter sp. TMED64]|tara:strand:- start:811 stop:1677 length:867 start_codon:yes stop_codon:yes gene_type:complete